MKKNYLTLQVAFEAEVPSKLSNRRQIQMKTSDSEKNPLGESIFDSDANQIPEEVIKKIMENELGLVENPTSEQLKQIVDRSIIDRKRKPKGKTVYFKDFIEKDAIDEISEDFADIIDAEIVKKTTNSKIRND